MTFTPMDPEAESSELEAILDHDALRSDSASQSEGEDRDRASPELAPYTPSPEAIAHARRKSLAALEGEKLVQSSAGEGIRQSQPTTMQARTHERKRRRGRVNNAPDAVIVLKEERVDLFLFDYHFLYLCIPQANTFHDFLKFVYPQYARIRPSMLTEYSLPGCVSLECTITWNNVEGLMNISHKLCVPALQQECLTFLLTHAAGKPIKAMRIAELFEEEELYREASRFVLDNPGGWTEQELGTLSQTTLLKLEKR